MQVLIIYCLQSMLWMLDDDLRHRQLPDLVLLLLRCLAVECVDSLCARLAHCASARVVGALKVVLVAAELLERELREVVAAVVVVVVVS